MLTDLIYCYLLGENIIWWKKPKAADWPSGEVQLDFLIWLDISNLLACLCHGKRLYEIERAKEFFEVLLA